MYEKLDAELIARTLGTLSERISERFPDASLAGVSTELGRLAADSNAALERIGKPRPVLRAAIGAVIVAGLAALAWLARAVSLLGLTADAAGVMQGIDATFNIVVLTGGALFYLVTLERRLKRNLALKDLHKLRSIVHVIDMHQLTKDPSATLAGGGPTAHSPKRTLTSFELIRYLDYCSELLSLTGKVAALYAQVTPDATVVTAVQELEQLATSLSQKIWQKILIAQLYGAKDEPPLALGRDAASADPLPS
jgi:hypothetical protein